MVVQTLVYVIEGSVTFADDWKIHDHGHLTDWWELRLVGVRSGERHFLATFVRCHITSVFKRLTDMQDAMRIQSFNVHSFPKISPSHMITSTLAGIFRPLLHQKQPPTAYRLLLEISSLVSSVSILTRVGWFFLGPFVLVTVRT
jgi:hypothetical protein